MTDDVELTEDERLEELARQLKDELPETNPDAANWPDDVRSERIDQGDQ